MIVNINLSEYMASDDRMPMVRGYAEAVDAAIVAGTLSGPFTSTCPECGDSFADADAVHGDTLHIIVALTSDTFAVVVGCEGYFAVNPNLVGIDSPMWMGPDDHFGVITPDGSFPGTPGAPTIVTSRTDIEDRLRNI